MADPILHIKDAYFFEVPKFLWRPHYRSLQDVPQFLADAHPEASLDDFNHDLAGKIIIPQYFGTLKNLYEAQSGFCVSKVMIIEVVAALLIFFAFKKFANLVRADRPPEGKKWNALEGLILFVRDGIARTAIGPDGDKYVPLLGTVFFFVLTLNLIGMLPWVGAATAAFSLTLTLATFMLVHAIYAGSKNLGVIGFWTNMIPKLDLPWWMFPLKVLICGIIFFVEVIGLFIKHGVLGVRLLANIVAGHLVLTAVIGMIASAAALSLKLWGTVAIIASLAAAAMSVLELAVCFLQAYVFTFLAAVWLASVIHSHGDHGHDDDHGHGHEAGHAH
ncbi:MAG: F0F1 ATP synthase subunit A [Planctomycetaceae bacterium]